MGETVRIHSIMNTSICDGPGIRTVIFFQGCIHACKDCHNPETWDFHGGELWSIERLILYIKDTAKMKRITLSGGEPLEQKEGIEKIVQYLHNLDYDIALYTGYDIEQVPVDILHYLNYIKVGDYRRELRTTTMPYIGSSNQKFLKIENGREITIYEG